MLEQPNTINEFCTHLDAEYNVDPDTCRADTTAFLKGLVDAKLVRALDPPWPSVADGLAAVRALHCRSSAQGDRPPDVPWIDEFAGDPAAAIFDPLGAPFAASEARFSSSYRHRESP